MPTSSIGTVLIVALSGLLIGYDGSLFTGALIYIRSEYALDQFETGWAVVSHTLTATLAIFAAGPLSDRLGRRRVLRIAALSFVASAVVAAFAAGFDMLIVARLLSGLGVGFMLVASPLYIAEIAPPALRGRMVTFSQLFLVFGGFAAFASSWAIERLGERHGDWLASQFAQWNWRWMLGIGALPSAAYLLALFRVPESPRWLARHGRLDDARRVLARAHGDTLAEAELDELRASLAHEDGRNDATLRDLWAPALRRVLVVGLIVAVVQQITGINAVLAYATVIFQRLGAGPDAALWQTMVVGFVNVLFTVLAMLLIDRVGRRPLLIWGSVGIAAGMFVASYGFQANDGALDPRLVLVGLLAFIASFAVSLGGGMWVLLSEIFPNKVRGLAISFIGLVNSAVCLVVQFLFPWQMEEIGGARTFLIYAAFAALGTLLLTRYLPETRGRSLEELEESLVRRS